MLALLLVVAAVPPAHAADPPEGLQAARLPTLARDAVYDPVRDLLYVSVPSVAPAHGNEVVALDPATGAVRRSVWAGSEPAALALADDSSALYVGLVGANELVRIDPEAFAVVARTALHRTVPAYSGPAFVADLEVQPGDPDVVVASLAQKGSSPSHLGVAAIDGDGVRPVVTPDHTGPTRLSTGPDADTFYGYNDRSTGFGVYTLELAADGVRVVAEENELLSGFNASIEHHDGRLYSTRGTVVDPAAATVLGVYATMGAVEPVTATDRTYVFARDGLAIFHRTRFTPIAALPVAGVAGTPQVLVATSAGFAGVTDEGALYLFNRAVVPPPPVPTFSDVAGHTHEAGIVAVAEVGITAGYADGTFRPDLEVRRGQMATFLVRALDLPTVSGATFTDTVGHTHAASIAALAATGITTGYPDGSFRPEEPVRRDQMASFLARALELPAAGGPAPFLDVAGPHAAAIAALHEAGIAAGTGPDTFSPGRAVRRGQMATFLARGLDLVERVPVPTP